MKNLKGKTVFRRAFLFQSNSCYWKSAISGLLLFLFTNTLALAQTVNSFIADFFLFSGESTELIIEVTGTPEQLQNSYISAICVDCEGKVFFEDTSIPFTDEMIKGGQPIIITLPVKAFINVFWAEYWIEVKWHPGEPGSRKEPETVTVEDTISVEMICNIVKTESSAPAIQGGLIPGKQSFKILRDDYIPLMAEASDFDIVTITCNEDETCFEQGTRATYVLNGPLAFHWEIKSKKEGVGQFVEVGCMPRNLKKTTGDQVIFEPPQDMPIIRGVNYNKETKRYTPITKDTTVTTQMVLTIEDVAGTLKDEALVRNIEIKTTRKANDPDYYYVEVKSADFSMVGVPDVPQQLDPDQSYCMASLSCTEFPVPTLPVPAIKKSAVKDAESLAYKEWRVFSIDPSIINQGLHYVEKAKGGRYIDNDAIRFDCNSTMCQNSSVSGTYADRVSYTWTIEKGGGRFVLGNQGTSVIYEAPLSRSEVTISVYASNPAGPCPDYKSDKTTIVLMVGEPFVQLDELRRSWRPKYNINLEVTGKFKIKWPYVEHYQDAPAHVCKFVSFELEEVSNEPGIACNYDKNEEERIDLYFDKETSFGGFEFSEPTGPPKEIKPPTLPEDNERIDQEGEGLQVEKPRIFLSSGSGNKKYYWKKATSSLKLHNSFNTTLHCMDWGAYAKLIIDLYPDYYKIIYQDPDYNIPLDKNDNNIADGQVLWDKTRKGKDRSGREDLDHHPSHNANLAYKGDGFSAYEEYRGFYKPARLVKGHAPPKIIYETVWKEVVGIKFPEVKKKIVTEVRSEEREVRHISTSPETKDVFILDVNYAAYPNIRYFERATKIKPHFVIKSYVKGYHWVNFNSGKKYNLGKQHAIVVGDLTIQKLRENGKVFTTLGLRMGKFANRNDKYATPGNTQVVLINVNAHRGNKTKLMSTVAHELSHAVNVKHHGPGGINQICLSWPQSRLCRGVWMPTVGGKYSGVDNCFMRYRMRSSRGRGLYNCIHQVGIDFHTCACIPQMQISNCHCDGDRIMELDEIRVAVRRDPQIMDQMCNTKVGSGVNQGGCAGNATNGNCIHQLRVKDFPQ